MNQLIQWLTESNKIQKETQTDADLDMWCGLLNWSEI